MGGTLGFGEEVGLKSQIPRLLGKRGLDFLAKSFALTITISCGENPGLISLVLNNKLPFPPMTAQSGFELVSNSTGVPHSLEERDEGAFGKYLGREGFSL